MKEETKAIWHPPQIYQSDYDDAADNNHCVLCVMDVPCGRGKAKRLQQVVPVDYTPSGRFYFDVDIGIVRAWTHLPKAVALGEEYV